MIGYGVNQQKEEEEQSPNTNLGVDLSAFKAPPFFSKKSGEKAGFLGSPMKEVGVPSRIGFPAVRSASIAVSLWNERVFAGVGEGEKSIFEGENPF